MGVGPAGRSHGGLTTDRPAGRVAGWTTAFCAECGRFSRLPRIRGEETANLTECCHHPMPVRTSSAIVPAGSLASHASLRRTSARAACQPALHASPRRQYPGEPPSWIPPARPAPRVTNVLRAMGKRCSRLTKLLSSPLIPTVILGIRYRSKMPQRRVRAGGRGASVSQSLHIITCACCRSIPRLPRRRCRVARA
ncbi:hypothetical protein HMPREF1868_01998 [Olsenella sp. DNF00959]|nr:hypothetical protein HMPREF1868_01998 [Olsenella sp. DNF00959]